MKILCTLLLSAAAIFQLYSRELHIIATCDMHGKLSGFARLLPAIQQYPDALKLDLGDIFQGEPLSDLLNGTPMIDALNLAKYDFFIPGNHEFELSPSQLAPLLKRFNGQILGQWKMENIKTAPWQLVERNGFTLAIIGMTDNGIFRDRKFFPEIKIVPELAAVEKAIREIRKHKVDAVILARHGGNYLSNMPLGRFLHKYPEIRLVICGHSHKEIAGQRSGRTLVVQPGAYCTSAVMIKMRYTEGKNLLLTSSLLRPCREPEPGIVLLQQKLEAQHGELLQQKQLEFTSFDTQISQWLKNFCTATGADCAILDTIPLPSGSYTLRQLLKHFPYRNRMVKLSVTRAEFAALLKEKVPAGRQRFASTPPHDKETFTVVMDTFQFSRSKTLNKRTDFQMLPVVSRDIILKEYKYE